MHDMEKYRFMVADKKLFLKGKKNQQQQQQSYVMSKIQCMYCTVYSWPYIETDVLNSTNKDICVYFVRFVYIRGYEVDISTIFKV